MRPQFRIILKLCQAATADEQIDHCRGRIAHYKVQRCWRLTDHSLMTVSGKVQK